MVGLGDVGIARQALRTLYHPPMTDAAGPLIIFPDTNVLIQGRALNELPWDELSQGDIEIILCGPVIRELDRLKNKGGRAGRVARAMSSLVRTLMDREDQADILRETGPRVTRRLAPGRAVEKVREGLDLNHDDQAIINQALARFDDGDDVILLTDDNFAAMTARDFGLPVRLLPDHWLKPPEADDTGKELAKRDAEIARLKAAEPVLKLRFVDHAGAEIDRLDATMPRYQPVPAEMIERLLERIEQSCPMASVTPTQIPPVLQKPKSDEPFDLAKLALRSFMSHEPVTQDQIDAYERDYHSWLSGIRARLAGLEDDWNRRRDWPSAEFRAQNVGTRPANDVLVEIQASGDFELSGEIDEDDRPKPGDDWLSFSLPPKPPEPVRHDPFARFSALSGRPVYDPALYLSPSFSKPRPRDDDRFYWRSGRSSPVETLMLDCKVWRHGRDEEDFSLQIWGSDEAPIKGLITGRISASNLSAPLEARLPLRIAFEDRDLSAAAEQMVDDLERKVRAGKFAAPTER